MTDFYLDSGERQLLLSSLEKQGTVTDYEITLKNRDGSLIPCSISSKIWPDAQGKPIIIVGSMRDITARKASEAEPERLMTAIEHAAEIIFITNPGGTIEYVNPVFESVTGGRTWEGRIVNKRKDGTLYTEAATISPVHNTAGRIVNYVSVKRDITERRIRGRVD